MLITAKIVIVDDEIMVTKTLKTLLKLEGFLNVQTFNSPLEALDFVKNNQTDLIISDFIMPDLNGIEFLSKAKKILPDTTQILLTGYADKENAIRAINELGIFKYIEKPWNNDDVIANIKNGIERTHLKNQLNNKIKELECANQKLEEYSKKLEEKVQERTIDLNETNLKLNTIIENLADGLVIFDANNIITQTNEASDKLFQSGSLIGKNFFEIIINEKNQNIKDAKYLRDFSIINYENNAKIPVEINLAKVNSDNKDGSETINIALVRDVTFQKENERLRDDFIATLTHDLRTPLLASINAIDFVLMGDLGEFNKEQTNLFSTMKRSFEDMLGLVNALLEVYRYESGKLFLCKSKFSLNSLIKETALKLEPLCKEDNVSFEFQMPKDEDFMINADKNEIRRVISNLIGNAIKHSKNNGKILIKTDVKNKDVKVDITDFGEGLNEDDIAKLFKRFSQGTSKKRSASTGLGLYLSRQIVEAHQGKIFAKGDLGKGCTFSFVLKNCVEDNKVLS